MAFKTNAQLEIELKAFDALLGDEYVPSQPTSDYEAYEVYKRNFDEARDFLLIYADMVAKTGKPYVVEESEKIRRLIDAFESASDCNEVLLATTNFMIAYSLKQAIGEVPQSSPYAYAAFIVGAVKEAYKPNYNEFIGGMNNDE